MAGISVVFPGVKALDLAALTVRPGEVHGLVGENGAGKSTMIKVLAGVYAPDEGAVSLDGERLVTLSPNLIHAAGVRFIHQELHLVPHFTVAESVFMGQETSGRFGLDNKKMNEQAEVFLRETLNAHISPRTLIRDLGTAEKKLVQITRALIDGQAKLVVFDEPTAPLAIGEVDRLFAAIEGLKANGIAMIYVSHYLGEITQICDRVTVLRNGKTVKVFDEVSDQITDKLISAMVGREITDLFPKKANASNKKLFEVTELSGRGFSEVSFEVAAGEVLGVAGLVGSGREELIDTIYGLLPKTSGEMKLKGETYNPTRPAKAVKAGVALVPRDRRHDGLVLDQPVVDNINLASLDEVSIALMEKRAVSKERAEVMVEQLDLRPRNVMTVPRLLSGGNQQKVVLGRWLVKGGDLFILDEPTVGVDVGAKVEIYNLIRELATNGSAVIVSSGDPLELLGLSDRIMVLRRGCLTNSSDVQDLNVDSLVGLTTGGSEGSLG